MPILQEEVVQDQALVLDPEVQCGRETITKLVNMSYNSIKLSSK